MLIRLKAFIAENFWSHEKRTVHILTVAKKLIEQLKHLKPDIMTAITPSGQLVLMREEKNTFNFQVIAIIELKRAAYEAQVIFNSLNDLSSLTNKIDYIVRDIIEGEVGVQSIELAYSPQQYVILMGPAAIKYMEQLKPNLSVVKNLENLN